MVVARQDVPTAVEVSDKSSARPSLNHQAMGDVYLGNADSRQGQKDKRRSRPAPRELLGSGSGLLGVDNIEAEVTALVDIDGTPIVHPHMYSVAEDQKDGLLSGVVPRHNIERATSVPLLSDDDLIEALVGFQNIRV